MDLRDQKIVKIDNPFRDIDEKEDIIKGKRFPNEIMGLYILLADDNCPQNK